MKALKIAGIALAAILLLALSGIAIVVSQFDAPRIKAEAAKVVYEKQQRTLKIDGDLKLSFWPNVGVSVGKVSLSEHKGSQEFAAIDAARVSVAVLPLISGQVVVNEIQLSGLKATVTKRKDGRLNIADLLAGDEKPKAAGGAPLILDIAAVNIANAALGWHDEQNGSAMTISGLDLSTGRIQADGAKKMYSVAKLSLAIKGKSEGKTGSETFDLKIEAPRLSMTPEGTDGDTVTVTAILSGPQRNINAKLAASGLEGKGDVLKIAKLAADLDAKVSDLAVHGQFTGELHADLARQSADGRLTGQLDESKIVFKFGVAKFSPLALSFDLAVDKFNLDKYLPQKKAAEKTAAPATPAGVAALDFSALKGLNIGGSASVGQFQAQNIKLEDLRLQLRAAGDKLDIAPMSARLYEGTLNGSLSANAKDNAVTLRQNLAGVSVGPLLKDAAGRDMLEGHGSVSLDVSAHGRTVGEMKKALAGSANLSLKDGAIKGVNLAQSFRDLKGKLGAKQENKQENKQDSVVQGKAGDRTDFSELSASFKINGGILRNDDLSAKSPFLRLAGNGDIDVGESRLNYLLKASVVATAGGQGGQGLEQLKGLTVPVRLTGPFDNPSWNIEFAGLLGEAAKAKVEETKQKVQEKVQENVREKLKGLFGK